LLPAGQKLEQLVQPLAGLARGDEALPVRNRDVDRRKRARR
jgi:hypothetical protein